MKNVKDIIIYISIILVIILVRLFIITPVRVNGSSMFPTLKDGEIMLLNKVKYTYNNKIKRFDIVVVKTDEDKIIKRVIGLPGEKIEYKNDKLYINGKLVKENFRHAKTDDFNLEDIGYNTIPKGYYFVLGDNRTNSSDSRIIGPVSEKQIDGSASLVLFPFNEFGFKN